MDLNLYLYFKFNIDKNLYQPICGPLLSSPCVMKKKGKRHSREWPSLSVEGVVKEKDLKGPLKVHHLMN